MIYVTFSVTRLVLQRESEVTPVILLNRRTGHFEHFKFPLGQPLFSPSSGSSLSPCNPLFDLSYPMQYTSNHSVGNGRSIGREYGFIAVAARTKSEHLCTDCNSSQMATQSAWSAKWFGGMEFHRNL